MSSWIVDTTGTRRHIRHTGQEFNAGDNGYRAMRFRTDCGRTLKNYNDAVNTSYFCTDGGRYSTPCGKCLPDVAADQKLLTAPVADGAKR